VTQDGATRPAGQDVGYLINTAAGQAVIKSYGGSIYLSGSFLGRVKSADIGPTGGNIGANDGSQASYARHYYVGDAVKVTFRLGRSSVPYRFIVDGQYVDLTGTLTTAASPTGTDEYITLDFTSAGGRAVREIALEAQADNRIVGVYVAATETIREAPVQDGFTSVLLGDSYVYGSVATALGDGFGAVMADWLGIRKHTNSGSGGTGWVNDSGVNFKFHERIANGDLALGGTPDLIVLMGSYNDRDDDSATMVANVLTGLASARAQYPQALIIMLGMFPANTGPSADITSREAALAGAVAAFNDYWTRFIPVSTRVGGALISGTGRVGTTTGIGNSDIYTSSDQVHPPTAGHAFIGRFCAEAILNAFAAD